MTNPSQAAQADDQEAITASHRAAGVRRNEQIYRSGAYSLLARLLRSPPDNQVMAQVSGFAKVEPVQDEMAIAMSMLGLSASTSDPKAVDDEFHALFIGIGRGELVPYGSWYLTGFLMERPLGRLRDDLAGLGFQRQEGVTEPEDHVAALCEVMAILIEEESSVQVQSDFFDRHLADWMERFFTDLSDAGSAVFYRAVGRFGAAFISLEKRYLSMPV
ncbi:MAG: molecular chaperone TorD family protein [Candidatus Thiodiazotropha sp. (ex Monitilora ramsayi)]|nr:molecular chaperone TorD family protein [Candidatus Thiodiazotropha sp. (ex Monitilora ramsayi)]